MQVQALKCFSYSNFLKITLQSRHTYKYITIRQEKTFLKAVYYYSEYKVLHKSKIHKFSDGCIKCLQMRNALNARKQ